MVGNWINKTEFNNVNDLEFSLEKNGMLFNKFNSFNAMENRCIIAYVSKFFTLKIGDIIFTGTPSGVGKMLKMISWLEKYKTKKCFR